MFEILYSRQALKFLKKVDKATARRILAKIGSLKENPIIPDSKFIEGYNERLYRVRVGEFRIIYEIDFQNRSLGIVKIDKRERVY